MLSPSNISVHILPISFCIFSDKSIIISWIHISDPISARSSPARHCIGFSSCWFPICGCSIDPFCDFCKRSFLSSCWFIMIYIWQKEWQIWLLKCDSFSFWEDDGKRLSPISLSRKYPVLNLEICFLSTKSSFFKSFLHFRNRFIRF